MNNLIDTHALIWFLNGDAELSKKARTAIEENKLTIISEDKYFHSYQVSITW